MAGAEGFEPPLAVLETAGLPLNLCPCVSKPVNFHFSLANWSLRLADSPRAHPKTDLTWFRGAADAFGSTGKTSSSRDAR